MENKSDHKLTLYEKIGAHLSGGFRLELPRSKEAKSIRRNSLMGLAFLAVNTADGRKVTVISIVRNFHEYQL